MKYLEPLAAISLIYFALTCAAYGDFSASRASLNASLLIALISILLLASSAFLHSRQSLQQRWATCTARKR